MNQAGVDRRADRPFTAVTVSISLQPAGFTFSMCHHMTLWALTPLISPLPLLQGGFVSVALSLGLPPVAVSDCRCPMLPGLSSRALSYASDHLMNCLTGIIHYYLSFREHERRAFY